MKTPDEKLQALLKLKSQESPPDEFFDQFLSDFKNRQRQDILRRGPLSLLKERVQDFLQSLWRPAVLWPAAGVYAAVILLFVLWPHSPPKGTSVSVWIAQPQMSNPQQPTSPDAPAGSVLVNAPNFPAAPVRQPGIIPVTNRQEEPEQPDKSRKLSRDQISRLVGPGIPDPVETPPPASKLKEL
jgi:hypothetical protein